MKYYVIKDGRTVSDYETYEEATKHASKIGGEIATDEATYERKEIILKRIKEVIPTSARNSMGCNESWYNPYYAMSRVFSEKELEAMSEEELNHLLRLGDAISEALY